MSGHVFDRWCVSLLAAMAFAGGASHAQEPRLTIPREFYAVPGVPMSIYYDNLVLDRNSNSYRFDVRCDIGSRQERRWSVTPSADDIGSHLVTVAVSDRSGKRIAAASTTLRVVPADAGTGRGIRLLIVGDSLTHATQYPNEVARLLSRPSNPRWLMLGTHRPKSAARGVAHEGYGGWTWRRFVSYYDETPPRDNRKHRSPFVYLVDGKPELDVRRYVKEACENKPPDFIVFLLGINDCFAAGSNPGDRDSVDHRIDAMLSQADILLKAFREAAPSAEIGICLTTPPNAREAAFEANYKGRYTRWGWKQVQHRLVQRELEHFSPQRRQKIFIVPTELNLDPLNGYPDDNAVHPNATGYKQIGTTIYAWLKWRLDEQERTAASHP